MPACNTKVPKPRWPARLLAWYERNQRDLPWRRTHDPYRIVVSELMLQQTRVDTVIPYYHRFLRRFPSFRALARAKIEDVLSVWQGLGYYTRARNLHRLAQTVVAAHRGRLPRTAAELVRLPGIGPYTAAAVASIAFGDPVPVVDGNVERVLARFLTLPDRLKSPRLRRHATEYLAERMSRLRPGDFNQALMELGALVCLPANPRCTSCPLRVDCRACRTDATRRFPRPPVRRAVPVRHLHSLVLRHGQYVYLCQRPARGFLAGFHEPPTRAAPFAPPDLAPRCAVTLLHPAGTIVQAYSHFTAHITVMAARCATRPRSPVPGVPGAWVSAKGLVRLPVHAAARRILALAAARIS